MFLLLFQKDVDNCHTCGVSGGCAARPVWYGDDPARTTAYGRAHPQPARPVQRDRPARARPGERARGPHDPTRPSPLPACEPHAPRVSNHASCRDCHGPDLFGCHVAMLLNCSCHVAELQLPWLLNCSCHLRSKCQMPFLGNCSCCHVWSGLLQLP